MPLFYNTNPLAQRIQDVEKDTFEQQAIHKAQDTIGAKRNKLVADDPNWEKKCEKAASIRDHVLDNLDFYVKQFAEAAIDRGTHVHFAPAGEDAVNEIIDIIKKTGEKSVVKSKSMMTEEIGLNHALEAQGIHPIETDCAENILQTAEQNPSHIVVPALHLDRTHIAEVYRKKYGYTGTDDPHEITHFLRKLLRPKFLGAHVGITGCNFGVAQTGTCTLVTNEGNARMVSGLPETLIIVMGIDRIVPDLPSLDLMNGLLVRSAVGAKMTSSFTLNTGHRASDEGDGPRQTHIVLIDNGRSRLLNGPYQKMLRCIRCGACMNICPVYRQITGHGYGSIYPGPMGIVLTPQLDGYKKAGELPYACSLCGGCASVCPMKIPINSLILHERQDMVAKGRPTFIEKFCYKTAGHVLGNVKTYNWATKRAATVMKKMGPDGRLKENTANIPILGGWTATRDLRNVQASKFRDQFAAHDAHRKAQMTMDISDEANAKTKVDTNKDGE